MPWNYREGAVLRRGVLAGRPRHERGLVTDERSRVLREDGSWIEGLYATGNNSASVMGHTYPGPGSTLGPTTTFGYLAVKDIVENETHDTTGEVEQQVA